MAHIQFVDELVREYLLFRGFTSTVKSFDNDLKVDKDKGFRVDKIVEQILHYVNVSDLSGLREYWSHLDNLVFSKLEVHVQPAVRKIEYSLYKLYLVTAAQNTGGVKNEKVSEFLSKMLPELQGQNEWKEWFMLPYMQKPEENPSFSLYYTRAWQDSVLVSLHNLLATVFQCMPQPTLTSYESDTTLVKRLQDEITALRSKICEELDVYLHSQEDRKMYILKRRAHAQCHTRSKAFATSKLTAKASPLLSMASTVLSVIDQLVILKAHQPSIEKTSPIGHQSRLAQYSERLSGPLPLVDDFCAVPAEQLDNGLREARGLRGLLRQMGGSPVMGRKAPRSQSQN